jgi:transposase
MLPKDFQPWPTVYWWFRRFVRRFLFQTIHDVALMLDRERVGREASPTGGVIVSQSVKAPEAKTRNYDAGKKIVGRKQHIAVDTDGRLLMVNLTAADISDGAGAQMILDSVRKRRAAARSIADAPIASGSRAFADDDGFNPSHSGGASGETYSAASCRGAGGGLTRSAANCAYRAFASATDFSFTGP